MKTWKSKGWVSLTGNWQAKEPPALLQMRDIGPDVFQVKASVDGGISWYYVGNWIAKIKAFMGQPPMLRFDEADRAAILEAVDVCLKAESAQVIKPIPVKYRELYEHDDDDSYLERIRDARKPDG